MIKYQRKYSNKIKKPQLLKINQRFKHLIQTTQNTVLNDDSTPDTNQQR